MPRKPSKHNTTNKKPFAVNEEFPRKCNQCAKKKVELETISYDANMRHDGRSYSFTVPKLEIMVCKACNEKVFTGKVDQQIIAAMRKHIGLMSPAEIREGIKRIGMSQKEVAERVGIAEATLSRWLNETQIQSRSMDKLLRAYFSIPSVRKLFESDPIVAGS